MTLTSYLLLVLLVVVIVLAVNLLTTWYHVRGLYPFGVLRGRHHGFAADQPGRQQSPVGAHLPDVSEVVAPNPSASLKAAEDFGITFDGKQYVYAGYRYDRESDALAYAQLIEARRPRENAA